MNRLIVSGLFLLPSTVLAEQVIEPISMSKTIMFVTGDTWKDGGAYYRLYGVQSCIRGTTVTNAQGEQYDCGDASIAQLAALFVVADVACQPVGYAFDKATFVVCGVTFNTETVDLGTAMITSGYGFAATTLAGKAVNDAYLVAEIGAKMSRKGLWQTSFPHPVTALLRAASQ
jgi:endonuclease YncB( thermonuclease family)